MAVCYSMARQEYEKKKKDYRFAVKYFDKNKELLKAQKSLLNPILDEIIRCLDSAINESDYLIRISDDYCDDKIANLDCNSIINASKMTIENSAILIRETISKIFSDDPMSLQGILLDVKTGLIGILCNSNRIYAKINSTKTTT